MPEGKSRIRKARDSEWKKIFEWMRSLPKEHQSVAGEAIARTLSFGETNIQFWIQDERLRQLETKKDNREKDLIRRKTTKKTADPF